MVDPFAGAVVLAEQIRRGEASSVEVVSACIERMDRYDGEINAIVWRNDEDALRAARAADEARAAGGELPPFHGVPIPIKELNSVAGQPNTLASLGISDAPRERSDLAVDLLARAGFVFLGRSNSPEMGPMSVSENRRFGITRNPWDLERSPGGSSGGAAAAVIAGLAPVAHASDGGGSIRMPSSCCGTVGLKPSRGRVPSLVPAWEHSVTEGAITRSVQDTAALLDVMSVPDRCLAYHAPPPERPYAAEVGAASAPLRIGLMLESTNGVPVDWECVVAAETLAAELEALGHHVQPAAPALYSLDAILGFVDVIVNASLYLNPYDEPEQAEPYIQHRMRRARDFHAGEYAVAAARLYEETHAIVGQWGRDFDVLLTPTMATQAPPVGVVLQEANDAFDGPRLTENQMIAFTAFCNVSGLPAISLPVHTAPDGLPVGAQLIGAPFDEATLIRLASAVEGPSGWLDRVPPALRVKETA